MSNIENYACIPGNKMDSKFYQRNIRFEKTHEKNTSEVK
jgi:hypothetical protein